jgi:hypothetical protein
VPFLSSLHQILTISTKEDFSFNSGSSEETNKYTHWKKMVKSERKNGKKETKVRKKKKR